MGGECRGHWEASGGGGSESGGGGNVTSRVEEGRTTILSLVTSRKVVNATRARSPRIKKVSVRPWGEPAIRSEIPPGLRRVTVTFKDGH